MMVNMLDELREEIEKTEYWDAKAYDFSCNFFGDEVCIYYDNDDETVWRVSFQKCSNVEYVTDAAWESRNNEKIKNVRDMKKSQLGYYVQKIDINSSNRQVGYYDVFIDLSIMTANVTCKNIAVDVVPIKSNEFFRVD